MRVRVEGDPNRRVSEALRNHFRMFALPKACAKLASEALAVPACFRVDGIRLRGFARTPSRESLSTSNRPAGTLPAVRIGTPQ